MLMWKNHYLLWHFDSYIMRLLQSGLINKWVQDFEKVKPKSGTMITKLKLRTLQGPFYILVLGLFISTLVFMYELFFLTIQ